jgi:hypothetical protein
MESILQHAINYSLECWMLMWTYPKLGASILKFKCWIFMIHIHIYNTSMVLCPSTKIIITHTNLLFQIFWLYNTCARLVYLSGDTNTKLKNMHIIQITILWLCCYIKVILTNTKIKKLEPSGCEDKPKFGKQIL